MNSYRHFPITSARYELEEPAESIGQRFSTEIIPIGQVSVRSGRLAIGDPLLGMSNGANPWLAVPPGAYSVVLTRLLCLDREDLEIPAYLSLILDQEEIEKRRQLQAEQIHVGGGGALAHETLSYMGISGSGQMEEAEESEGGQEDQDNLAISRSGVVGMVDEAAFEHRMPNPLHIDGGWFERYFDTQSKGSWIRALDDADHMSDGVANLALPEGPDDWNDEPVPTIALVQMASPGTYQIFIEYAVDDYRQLNPIAVHVELGLHSALQGVDLQTTL